MGTHITGRRLWLAWALLTTLAWSIAQYGGFAYRQRVLTSLEEIWPILLALGGSGILLGSAVGVLQALVIRPWWPRAGKWFGLTFLGHLVGIPSSFVLLLGLTTLVARGQGLAALTVDSHVSLYMPLSLMMVTTGAIVALFQWWGLRGMITSPRLNMALLWIIGTAVGWGAGFWAAAYGSTAGFPLLLQNVSAGLAVGFLTGALLVFLLSSRSLIETLQTTH